MQENKLVKNNEQLKYEEGQKKSKQQSHQKITFDENIGFLEIFHVSVYFSQHNLILWKSTQIFHAPNT
jgi:hypothetical protein